jgi:hypothetical protein
VSTNKIAKVTKPQKTPSNNKTNRDVDEQMNKNSETKKDTLTNKGAKAKVVIKTYYNQL